MYEKNSIVRIFDDKVPENVCLSSDIIDSEEFIVAGETGKIIEINGIVCNEPLTDVILESAESDSTNALIQFQDKIIVERKSTENLNTTIVCKYCSLFSSDNLKKILHHCRTCPIEEIKKSPFKILVCILCSYSTRESQNMRKHLRIHLGDKRFCCNFCSYKSTHSNALKNHIRNHTGEKPFICSACPHKSASLSGLNYHKLKHHPVGFTLKKS